MKLIDAIIVAHAGKYKKLNTINHGSFYSYNPQEDVGYQNFCHAMNILSLHKIITMILRWIKFI